MAMLLMKKTGRPRPSAAYGITEPNGNPANFRECVDRLPILATETSVRARSTSEGSGTSGAAGGGAGAGGVASRHASMVAKPGPEIRTLPFSAHGTGRVARGT